MARKMRQRENTDIFIVTYTGPNVNTFFVVYPLGYASKCFLICGTAHLLENKTDGMLEWAAQHDVKIFDFGNIPHLTKENVQSNQRWDKWCVVRTMMCNITTQLV